MLFLVEEPSRWWRRGIYLRIPLWPNWLAQRLCKHERMTSKLQIASCPDCYKCVIAACKHPMSNLVVDKTAPVPNGGGGMTPSPLEWHCSCGKQFTRNVNCPYCKLQMEITEYMGMFSARFHCTQCCEYFFREDLE